MGWSTGSSLMEMIAEDIRKKKIAMNHPATLEQIYLILIDHFRDYDCDTLNEVDDKFFKKVYKKYLEEK
jgi:hypothetical protein